MNGFNRINYIKSLEPIIIRISKEDFSLPLSFFKLENLNIKHATLDLNKMIISNTGVINTVTNLAKMPSAQTVSLWFTYVNFKIENGIFYSDRMDFLINNDIHLCSWGKINLIDKNLKMYFGITSDTLESIFSIQNLSDDYVIKIPVRYVIVQVNTSLCEVLSIRRLAPPFHT